MLRKNSNAYKILVGMQHSGYFTLKQAAELISTAKPGRPCDNSSSRASARKALRKLKEMGWLRMIPGPRGGYETGKFMVPSGFGIESNGWHISSDGRWTDFSAQQPFGAWEIFPTYEEAEQALREIKKSGTNPDWLAKEAKIIPLF